MNVVNRENYSSYLLLIAIFIICSCTNENNIFDSSKIFNFSVSVPEWKNNDSSSASKTRAIPISAKSFNTSSSFNMIADVYDGNSSYSTIIKDETVSYTNNMWQTTSTYYWSGTSTNTVSFYAYYPTNISGNISHTAGSAPNLSYTVPSDAASQFDIITTTGVNVSGNTNSSIPLVFNHIFAAINFSVGSSGMPNGTIKQVTLNNIQYFGNYIFGGAWNPNTSLLTSFSQAVSASSNAGTSITSGVTTFMMMPQTLSNNASITVTYSNNGTLTKSISGTWEAGKIYTYNISKIIQTANFTYTGDVQTYTIPLDGIYKIECWGAQGACCDNGDGGKGGYTEGEISMKAGTIVYLYVGQNPTKNSLVGGWNGGGNGSSHADANGLQTGCAGGGATDVRLVYSKNCLDFNSLKSRIMVAGGGSGTGFCELGSKYSGIAGGGGGLNGIDGNDYTQNGSLSYTASGGTQTSGGNTKNNFEYVDGDPTKGLIIDSGLNKGGFGYGGTNDGFKSVLGGCAGGSGYYGGGASNRGHGGGGGGSSFISGYTGCNAILESSTSDKIQSANSPNHYSKYIFTNSQMTAGNTSMPTPSGGTETGHTGNGYARITFVSAN
ncbi:fimbrillin family protein [Xylanibacter oryzae]|uniref:fimbrillin family protein n=1 Tax=Xylanibacter oryzae TaxID=185293 RepID=UPI000A0361DD